MRGPPTLGAVLGGIKTRRMPTHQLALSLEGWSPGQCLARIQPPPNPQLCSHLALVDLPRRQRQLRPQDKIAARQWQDLVNLSSVLLTQVQSDRCRPTYNPDRPMSCPQMASIVRKANRSVLQKRRTRVPSPSRLLRPSQRYWYYPKRRGHN